MLTKLFGLYPPRADSKLTLHAYFDETQKVPTLILQRALGRLVRTRANTFVPSVYEILRESARVLREMHARAEGRDPNAHNPVAEGELEIDIDHWLASAPRVMDRLAAGPQRLRLEAPQQATPEQRAAGTALLSALTSKIGRRML